MTDRRIDADAMTPDEIAERLADIERRNGERGYGDLTPPGADRAFLLSLRSRERREIDSALLNIENGIAAIQKKVDRALLARQLLGKTTRS